MRTRGFLVTLGTFDGVHQGHRALIRGLVSKARRLNLGSRLLLFDRPPRFFFNPQNASPLLSLAAERARLLKRLGVSRVDVLRFNRRLADTGHEDFFLETLLGHCKARGLLVGPDFAFGRGRLGDVDYLRRACAEKGLHFSVLRLRSEGGLKISSTRIRGLLGRGESAHAAILLGRPYSLSGEVRRGEGLGRKLGFPTANVHASAGLLRPPGVHAVRVSLPSGRALLGVCNVGRRPTLGALGPLLVEAHIPGFSGNLYGKRLRIEFLGKIRDERKFASLDALKRQILLDARAAARVARTAAKDRRDG